MIHFTRPAEPTDMDFRDRIASAQRAVERAVAAGEQPVFEPAIWSQRDYKSRFSTAQGRGKCGFCERDATVDDPHVDHFAPKSAVYELPKPEHRGREVSDDLPNIRGRTPSRKHQRGYWWLAYEWNNWLLVCSTCNSKWKECYFPAQPQPRLLPPRRGIHEVPLLINPFDEAAPWRLFDYDRAGGIRGIDPEGRAEATIAVCGLDRETLVLRRMHTAQMAFKLVNRFIETDDEAARRGALDDLVELGGDERSFAGVVRRVAERETQLTWSQLRFLCAHWPRRATDSGD